MEMEKKMDWAKDHQMKISKHQSGKNLD